MTSVPSKTSSYLLLVGIVVACCVCSTVCADETYPNRPVKVIVPFSPGGGSDTFVRIVLGVIESQQLFPQPLVVINVPGAGGSIGSRRVRDVEPDGYTILNLHDGILSAKLAGQTEYGPEAFQAIAATGRTSSMVCVRSDARWDTLQQMLSEAADKPNTIKFGANLGALSHFDALRMEKEFPGAAYRYVPTGGGAKRFGDLLGDHIDVTVFNIAEFDQFREGGLRALAVFAKQRHPDFPDVPTATECGVNVVRDSMQYWWAPLDTPPDAVERFSQLLREAMNTPQLQAKLRELKMEPAFISGRELQSFLARQEIAMSSVGTAKPIKLPDTALLLICVTGLLGGLLIFQRLKDRSLATADGALSPLPVSVPPKKIQRSIATLCLLLLFCFLFSTKAVPFWFLSTSFIFVLGCFLLKRSKSNLGILLTTAIIVGPGCFYIFTKILTIDLP